MNVLRGRVLCANQGLGEVTGLDQTLIYYDLYETQRNSCINHGLPGTPKDYHHVVKKITKFGMLTGRDKEDYQEPPRTTIM